MLNSELPQNAELYHGVKDNLIIGAAYSLQAKGEHVIFISKDINARIKAEALGLRSADFEKQKIDIAHLYPGWRNILSKAKEIKRLQKTGQPLHVPHWPHG